MVLMRFREGDLVEDVNRIIFDVKGLVHPPNRVVAFPRFVPDARGDRKRGNIAYRKVYALSARYELLQKQFPQYLIKDSVFGEELCEVPTTNIKRHYRPVERLRELRKSSKLDTLEQNALEFISVLKESANIPWDNLGISGSILAKLHTSTSDIDPIVYGVENCRNLYVALANLPEKAKNRIKFYRTEKELRTLFEFRSKDTQVSFEDFVRTESRKVLQGKYLQHDYFIRCIKDWNETDERYGDVQYSNAGYAKIRATVVDDSEAVFTPCKYKIENIQHLEGTVAKPISEIVSFRGRFCEHARTDETVIAQGKVERVRSVKGDEHFRLLLGNKPSDFMILTS
jgi:predicted nucleotidyltransferase